MNKVLLSIRGMSCSACSNGLEKYLLKQSGVKKAAVNLVMANALIEFDETITMKDIEKFIEQAGFESAGFYHEENVEEDKRLEKRKIWIYLFLTILILYISMSHMVGLPVIPFLNMKENSINFGFSLFILVIPFLYYGFDLLESGYKNLINRMPNMDSLVSIGIISSLLYSLFNLYMIVIGNNENVEFLYFDAVATIIFFVKLGRYIDSISKNKTQDAIKKLVEITPKDATIIRDGVEIRLTIDEIKKNDIVVSRPGDRIAVDGEITKGSTHIDESFITGESLPVFKKVGSKVIAGSLNYDGYIEYKANYIGKDSTISEIVRLVSEASSTKAPIAKIADKISGYFVPVIIIIAILSFLVYILTGAEFSEAINTFVTVLVVACPCALGLATPLSIVVGQGLCASKGILVKTSEILENSNKVDTIIFDKTGTLTYGKLNISKVFNYGSLNDKDLLRVVGSIETNSTHPIAQTFSNYLLDNKIEKLEVTNFINISGYGVEAIVNKKNYYLGNKKLIDKLEITNNYSEDEKKLTEKGSSIIYVIENNKIIGLIGVNDIIRDNTKKVIKLLLKDNKEIIMLTGDNEITAKRIAESIGIKIVVANVLPKEKAELVKKLVKQGKKVMMVGDGINDAPALALADIGVSVNSGSDIALDSSNIILMNNDLSKIVDLMEISKKTIRIIKQNLFWAFFYNICMIPIAIGLLKPIDISMNPMIAGFAMTMSSVTIILNTLRLKIKKK